MDDDIDLSKPDKVPDWARREASFAALCEVATTRDPKKAAFPVYHGSWSESGMHLRDYFAAATLPLAWQSEHAAPTHGKEPSYRGVAERAYLMAHAMMVARENLPNDDVEPSEAADSGRPNCQPPSPAAFTSAIGCGTSKTK